MRRFFHKELESLRNHLSLMGEKACDALDVALKALFACDEAILGDIRGRDDAIDQLEMDIDQESIRYITLRAPVASDLRLVTVGMKTSHELERAADEASSVAQRTKKILHVGPVENIFSLAEMAKIVQEMLRASIKSFLNEDGLKALAICRRDKEVDHLNDQNTQALTQHIMEQPSHSQISIELIFISKSLERIADHATNIAEEVVFLHSGEDVRHDSALK